MNNSYPILLTYKAVLHKYSIRHFQCFLPLYFLTLVQTQGILLGQLHGPSSRHKLTSNLTNYILIAWDTTILNTIATHRNTSHDHFCSTESKRTKAKTVTALSWRTTTLAFSFKRAVDPPAFWSLYTPGTPTLLARSLHPLQENLYSHLIVGVTAYVCNNQRDKKKTTVLPRANDQV